MSWTTPFDNGSLARIGSDGESTSAEEDGVQDFRALPTA
jgi:hypothetical protein